MFPRAREGRRLAAALALATLAGGCSLPYLAHVSYGQARILVGRVPVEHYLERDGTSARAKEKLRLALDVRKFARELGLAETDSYTTVFDTEGEAAVWNLSACADDAFRAHTWSFPVVGTLPYKGYFDRSLADE
ncbi:aminopeptidase, partial [bacterium]|nr:aminopeptidase [bacterium]